ncbi:MAG: response regulator transcription factor [Bacillota bacterium]|nr:response regulator transcription factor [Bacillota bacterium]
MAPRKVLIVDDEPAIRELVQFNLERAGLAVVSAADGEEALALFRTEQPDLVLLDLMLPRLDGFTVCRRIREESPVPIIMLTARTAEQDRVEGLEMGADDYLIKPFSPRELVARVKAVLRRADERPATGDTGGFVLRHGPLLLDQERHEAFVEGRPVYLTPKEFALLAILMAHPGRVYSRETLLDRAWGYEFAGDTRTVDVHIRRLRQKVEKDPADPQLIETVHGLGYRLREKV